MTASVAVPLGGSSCIETTNSPRASSVATREVLGEPAGAAATSGGGAVSGERRMRSGVIPSTAFATARMCSGVVPQQPPIRRAPRRAASRANQAKYSGEECG